MNNVLRNIYAINFGVLFFTILTSYLVTKQKFQDLDLAILNFII